MPDQARDYRPPRARQHQAHSRSAKAYSALLPPWKS